MERFVLWIFAVMLILFIAMPANAKQRGGGCAGGSCSGGQCQVEKGWPFIPSEHYTVPTKPTKPAESAIVVEVAPIVPQAVTQPTTAPAACECVRPVRHALRNVLRFGLKACAKPFKAAKAVRQRRAQHRMECKE